MLARFGHCLLLSDEIDYSATFCPEYFLLLVLCLCFFRHMSGKPSQNLAGAIAGFIDLAFCVVFASQTTRHLLAEQGTLPR